MEETPYFTGKAHVPSRAVGDIYTCMYPSPNDETTAETWEVVEQKKGGWFSVVPILRYVSNNTEEVRKEIVSTAEAMAPFGAVARTGPSRVDLDGNLHLSLHIRGRGGGVKVLNRIISSA